LTQPKTAFHLFLHRGFAIQVWYDAFRWLGLVLVMSLNLFTVFESISGTVLYME